MHLCKVFGLKYICTGRNDKTDAIYYLFEKSERLNHVIELWDVLKLLLPDSDLEEVG